MTFFSDLEGYATDFQILGAGLIGLLAFTTLGIGQICAEGLLAGELLAVIICGFSAVVGLITYSSNGIVYTLVFGCVFASIGLLRRALALSSVLEICAYSFVAAISTVLATDFSPYLLGVLPNVDWWFF